MPYDQAMNIIRLLPVILSCLLLAAHAFRAGWMPVVVLCLALPFLLLIRHPAIPRIMTAVLLLGAAEWLRTMWWIAMARMEAGQDWERMAFILAGVAIFTGASALVFLAPSLRRRFASQVRG